MIYLTNRFTTHNLSPHDIIYSLRLSKSIVLFQQPSGCCVNKLHNYLIPRCYLRQHCVVYLILQLKLIDKCMMFRETSLFDFWKIIDNG